MAADVRKMTEDDSVLSISRMFFAYGLGNTVLFPLFHGASAVVHPVTPTVEELVGLVARHRPAVLFCVPSYCAVLTATADPELFSGVRVAVAAVPDDLGATRLRAFVVFCPGTCRPRCSNASSWTWCGRTTRPTRSPRSVRFVNALPRTDTGKLQRFALRAGGPDGSGASSRS